jgi:hypothetical protein
MSALYFNSHSGIGRDSDASCITHTCRLAAGANEEQCSKSHALISQDALTVANYPSTAVVIENLSSMIP